MAGSHNAGRFWLFLPFALALALAALTLLAPVRQSPKTVWAFLGAGITLICWQIVLWAAAAHKTRALTIEIVLRRQHYMQACVQGSLLLYWGWYWPPVYASWYFFLAQLIFAYAFDMLLCWSRRNTYSLGFAPFPVVFSMNLFFWFKPDWFYLEFVMIGLGLAAKELIHWKKEGRRTHIFNPSSFPLAVFSVVLLAAGTSGVTWGQEIATTQFYPPHMYLVLFLVAMPGQFFFGVTPMTIAAVLSTYLFGQLYFAVTGIYFFYDSYIPISVFLGMHLLFTDPSTAPRTELGRIIFGSLYGASTVALYQILGSAGMPTFYDKLLQVPLLNHSIKWIDALARSSILRRFDPARLAPSLAGGTRGRNLAYMGIWAALFTILSVTQGVGDSHPGQWIPFWQRACDDGRAFACPYLADLESAFCDQGSAWACNETGLMHVALARSGEDLRRVDPSGAAKPFGRGCELGSAVACQNLNALNNGTGSFASVPPELKDFPIVLRGSKGELREREPAELYALACRQGWPGTYNTEMNR
jgi:hypothetical protein